MWIKLYITSIVKKLSLATKLECTWNRIAQSASAMRYSEGLLVIKAYGETQGALTSNKEQDIAETGVAVSADLT